VRVKVERINASVAITLRYAIASGRLHRLSMKFWTTDNVMLFPSVDVRFLQKTGWLTRGQTKCSLTEHAQSLLAIALLEAGLFVTEREVAFMMPCHRAEAGVWADAVQSGRENDLGDDFWFIEVLKKTPPAYWPSNGNQTKADFAAGRAMHKIVNVLRADFYQRKRRGQT
jgi:hypothetical protein